MSDKISLQEARDLPGLFRLRVQRTPDSIAYRYFDSSSQRWADLNWRQMANEVGRWQAALKKENLASGSRVAIMLRNCQHWVMVEQAALALGLVVVPLYTNDRAENIVYIAQDADIKLIVLDAATSWSVLKASAMQLTPVQRIVSITPVDDADEKRLVYMENWLPDVKQRYTVEYVTVDANALATIVYTSGTTGKPKGVMLSHHNILWNADSGTDSVTVHASDIFLSFLPLSHMLERTVGYYIPMMTGAMVAYARSIDQLADDLQIIRPTILVTVPRIFERVYNKIKTQLDAKPPVARKLFATAVDVGWHRFLNSQGKAAWSPRLLLWPLLNRLVAHKIMAKLGGRMRLAVSGGAPLSADIGRTFIGLGLTISQGYGLTETSPIVTTNKLDDNDPFTVGQALRDVEVKLGENDELLVKSPGVMLGYWNNEKATRDVIDTNGWFHTGDKAKIDNNHISITGRIKEILVLSNGEKVPPADIEMAIANDPLFDQVLIVGEQRSYLGAIIVLNPQQWQDFAKAVNVSPADDSINSPVVTTAILERIKPYLGTFPGYAKVYSVFCTLEPWTIENSMMTPTLKLRRKQITEKYAEQISAMYKGH